jgi:4-hydroxybenzoyl-CoA thioesterase
MVDRPEFPCPTGAPSVTWGSPQCYDPLMFEVRFQTYWADIDAAGIVYYPHFFRFVDQAEDELFRAAGKERQPLLDEHRVWMPRVEAFSKYSKPIRHGAAIQVRLRPSIRGEKTVRYDFEILDDQTRDALAAGYVTAVCVDSARFKSAPIPDAIRTILENA